MKLTVERHIATFSVRDCFYLCVCSSMAILSCLKRAKTFKNEVVTFARLDYWSMLDLFDRLPLHDLVRLNGLASWWSGYVTKVCRTKRDITVHFGHKSDRFTTADHTQSDVTQDQFNLLKVTNIHSHTSDQLGHILPSITSLEIVIDGPQSYDIDDITYLILKWSHQLVNLKIKCLSDTAHVPKDNLNMQIKQLLLSLNTITTLRRLTIKSKWWQWWSQMQNTIDLSILSQLEYLYFHTGYNDFYNLRHSLVRYAGPNRNLKQIVLPSPNWFRPWNLLGEPQLLSKFTMLNFGFSNQITRDQLALFPNLNTVDLGYIHTQSKFTRLIDSIQYLKLFRNLSITFDIARHFDFDLQVPVDLPQLPLVTNLKLSIRAYTLPTSYSFFKSLPLRTILPNVESVHLEYDFDCTSMDWMAKARHKISYQMLKRYMRRQFSGVKCTFERFNSFC